jgi:hypothetical protein
MSDATPTPFDDITITPPAPRLSEESMAFYKNLLSDGALSQTNPAQYAAIRDTVNAAIRETGQALDPIPPTPQQLYDARRGISSGPDGSVALPAWLHSLVTDAAKPQDATAVDEHLTRAGKDAAEVRESAKKALERAKLSDVKIENLNAEALAQLAVWSRHLLLHDANRPK